MPHLVAASGLAAYLRDEETGDFHLLRLVHGAVESGTLRSRTPDHGRCPSDVATPLLRERVRAVRDPAGRRRTGASRVLAPRRGPRGAGRSAALGARRLRRPGVMGAKEVDARFTEQDLRLARGIADITSLALGQRTPPLGAGAVPRARRQPGRGLLGGGRRARSGSRSSEAGPSSSSAPTSRSGSRRGADGAITRCPRIASGADRRPPGSPPTPARTRAWSTASPRPTAARSGSATWCTWCAAPRGRDSSAA